MKKIYLLSCLLSLAACSKDEINTPNGSDNESVEVKFQTNLGEYGDIVASRISGNKFSKEDQIAIYASGTGEMPFTGKKTFTSDADGVLSAEDVFYKSTETVNFSAFYPASLFGEDGAEKPETKELNLSTDGTTGFGNVEDVLYATGTGSSVSPQVSLTFNHICTKIKVAVKAPAGLNISGAELYLKALPNGTINMNDASVTANGTAQDIKVPLVLTDDFSTNDIFGEAIIVPQTIANNTDFIGLKFADGTLNYGKTDKEIVLSPGNSYIFNVTVNGNILSFDIKETGWTVEEPVTIGPGATANP